MIGDPNGVFIIWSREKGLWRRGLSGAEAFCRFEWKGGTERLDRKSGCICGSDREINNPEIQNPRAFAQGLPLSTGECLLTMRVPEAHGMRFTELQVQIQNSRGILNMYV